MRVLGSPFRKDEASAPDPIREMLFGDMPIDQCPPGGHESDAFPWGAFVSARLRLAEGSQADAIAGWRRILEHPGLEARSYLQAWHFLRQHGQQPPRDVAKDLLGVVVEVAMPEGLDLFAAYSDHSARYYNYSGAAVIWEHPDTSLDTAIDQFLAASREVLAQIGPWEQPRPAPPPTGHTRMSFLTPSGLHIAQGPMAALSHDPLGGRVIQFAMALMRVLIAKTNAA